MQYLKVRQRKIVHPQVLLHSYQLSLILEEEFFISFGNSEMWYFSAFKMNIYIYTHTHIKRQQMQ